MYSLDTYPPCIPLNEPTDVSTQSSKTIIRDLSPNDVMVEDLADKIIFNNGISSEPQKKGNLNLRNLRIDTGIDNQKTYEPDGLQKTGMGYKQLSALSDSELQALEGFYKEIMCSFPQDIGVSIQALCQNSAESSENLQKCALLVAEYVSQLDESGGAFEIINPDQAEKLLHLECQLSSFYEFGWHSGCPDSALMFRFFNHKNTQDLQTDPSKLELRAHALKNREEGGYSCYIPKANEADLENEFSLRWLDGRAVIGEPLPNTCNDPYSNIFGDDEHRFKPLEKAFSLLLSSVDPEKIVATVPNPPGFTVMSYNLTDPDQALKYLLNTTHTEASVMKKEFILGREIYRYADAIASFAKDVQTFITKKPDTKPLRFEEFIEKKLPVALQSIQTNKAPKWITHLQSKTDIPFKDRLEKVRIGLSCDPLIENKENKFSSAEKRALAAYDGGDRTYLDRSVLGSRLAAIATRASIISLKMKEKIGLESRKLPRIEEDATKSIGINEFDKMLTQVLIKKRVGNLSRTTVQNVQIFSLQCALQLLEDEKKPEALQLAEQASCLGSGIVKELTELKNRCMWLDTV